MKNIFKKLSRGFNMTGHKKFSNLTFDFSSERKAKIANQTAKLKEEATALYFRILRFKY